MNEQEIKTEFFKHLNVRGRGTKAGLTKFQVQNYKRTEPTIGTMLEFLWRLDLLEFKEEEIGNT